MMHLLDKNNKVIKIGDYFMFDYDNAVYPPVDYPNQLYRVTDIKTVWPREFNKFEIVYDVIVFNYENLSNSIISDAKSVRCRPYLRRVDGLELTAELLKL